MTDIVDTTNINGKYDRPGSAYTEGKFARDEKYVEVHEDEAGKKISKTESVQQQQSDVLVLNTIYLRQKPKTQMPQLVLKPVRLESEQWLELKAVHLV